MKKNYVLESIKKRYVQVTWTHKIQEKQADIYTQRYKKYKTFLIIIDALTAADVLSLLKYDFIPNKVIAFILSLLTFIFNAFIDNFKYESLAKIHKRNAVYFLEYRNALEMLMSKYLDKIINISSMLDEFNIIEKELNECYLKAPITSNKAVEQARKALLEEEDNYVSSAEKKLILDSLE